MIELTWQNRAVLAALGRLAEGAANPRPAFLAIGEDWVESTKRRFDTGTAPDGSQWAPNKPTTLARKKGNQPLVAGGTLRDQIAYEADAEGVTIFSTKEYSATQQLGAEKGSFGRTKRNSPIPWGDIPARPYIGISPDDELMIEGNVSDYLNSLI
ncbi:phage virion morphogenesis protein [Methylophilus sp. YYY-1]|uniref:phage virion morphogenesis protein n=1 Tax=Methylophilus sp. YYY-1 TaxID=2682087 RepID=UPI0023B2BA95|nr:phage virion morphogenesis protein [Methylophilus sp. YYY-1]MDF0377688.1 phage virion morphogenesis protein [Methylophilus sp. YYY-1]